MRGPLTPSIFLHHSNNYHNMRAPLTPPIFLHHSNNYHNMRAPLTPPSVSVPIIATFCPFALQVGRTSPWSNDTTDLGKGSIKLQASIVWKGWFKSFSSYRRFYRTKSIGDNKNGQPDYRHHSKRSILR